MCRGGSHIYRGKSYIEDRGKSYIEGEMKKYTFIRHCFLKPFSHDKIIVEQGRHLP